MKDNLENKNTVKLSKKKIKTIILAIFIIAIVLVATYFGYGYYLAKKKVTSATEYKRDIYNSMLCEFNCPLKDQLINNKTQNAPDAECVKNCSAEFRTKNYSLSTTNKIDKDLLLKDGLLNDLSKIAKDCQTNAVNKTSMKFDMKYLSSCAVQQLEPLKQKYPYLN